MKKIRLTAISIICIITFFVGLTGCASVKDKSDISKNTPSTDSNTNGTSSQNSSYVMENKHNSFLSGNDDGADSIEYNKYIKKVWVVKNWSKGAYDYSSFYISKIANGEIEGKFSTGGIVVPNYRSVLGNLTGKINNDMAECQFSDKYGNKGDVKLVFKANDEIEATIEYTNKSQTYKDLSLDGTFLFKQYNLNDIDGFTQFKDQSFTVDLNSWGNVKFVSGRYIGAKHILTVCYLTNKDGDIIYDFDPPFPYDVDVKAVSFQDVNKDGLKDIIIVVGNSNDSSWQIATVFFQRDDGWFDSDSALDEEINDSGNNKDIKTITDYLSKKL